MKKVAKIILVNPQSQLLLVLRDNKPTILYPNHWAEIGGAIEENETPLAALKREIHEEISCEVENITPIGIRIDDNTKCRIYMFRGEIREKLENIRLTEGQELKFFKINELENLLMSPKLKEYIFENEDKIIS